MVRVSPGRKLLERRIRAAKEGIDLLSVAQDLTTLRKKGERWRGKCPICDNGAHSDAFSLDDELGLWHCFACGSGGDLVRLVELWGPFSVPEAVAWLGHTLRPGFARAPRVVVSQARQAGTAYGRGSKPNAERSSAAGSSSTSSCPRSRR